jgi:hypothetical protein
MFMLDWLRTLHGSSRRKMNYRQSLYSSSFLKQRKNSDVDQMARVLLCVEDITSIPKCGQQINMW